MITVIEYNHGYETPTNLEESVIEALKSYVGSKLEFNSVVGKILALLKQFEFIQPDQIGTSGRDYYAIECNFCFTSIIIIFDSDIKSIVIEHDKKCKHYLDQCPSLLVKSIIES